MTRKRVLVTLYIVPILVLCLFIIGACLVLHTRANLAQISDNRPVRWAEYDPQVSTRNKPIDVVFYRGNCPHCQHVIPYVYLLNKLSGKRIEYRDLNNTDNEKLATRLNGENDFPDARLVSSDDGNLNIKRLPLVQIGR